LPRRWLAERVVGHIGNSSQATKNGLNPQADASSAAIAVRLAPVAFNNPPRLDVKQILKFPAPAADESGCGHRG
jgi:hypothetical protein